MVKKKLYERKENVLEIIKNRGTISLVELSKSLNISTMTLYRDIRDMPQIILSKGNLVHNSDFYKENSENPFEIRKEENKAKKQAIANEAINYINGGDTVFFDGSSTIFYLTEQLRKKDMILTVVTISPMVTIALADCKNISIVSPGGLFDKINYIYTKDIEKFLKTININKAFVSCGAFNLESGFMDMSNSETEIKINIVKKCPEVNVLVDSHKYNRVTSHTWAQFNNITRLFTDSEIEKKDLKVLNKNISQVIVCS